MGNRINTVMQPCFFQLAGVLPADEAIARIKESVEQTYGRRGRTIVERNFAAIDRALERLEQVAVPDRVTSQRSLAPTVPDRRARLRAQGHRDADGGRRRPAAGERAAGRRHVPDRHGAVREAGHRQGDPDLGPRHLHRLRQVRHRLPARHHPHEGVHARGGGRRPGGVPATRSSARRTSPAIASPSRSRPTTAPAAACASTCARPRARPRCATRRSTWSRRSTTATSSGAGGSTSSRSRRSTAASCPTTPSRAPRCSSRCSSSPARAPAAARRRTSSSSPSCSATA